MPVGLKFLDVSVTPEAACVLLPWDVEVFPPPAMALVCLSVCLLLRRSAQLPLPLLRRNTANVITKFPGPGGN